MIDNESFKSKEYNTFKEVKVIKSEQYGSLENSLFKENDTLDEDNTRIKIDKYKDKSDHKKKNLTDAIKSRITQATSSISSIVTTASFVVVATVATATTFLSASPIVSDVELSPGNDYLMYSFNIEDVDTNSDYLLEVSNANYSYKVDLDLEEISGTLSGYVYDLKPNYEYDFKLLKDNGDIGGWTDFYNKSFYTPKAPNPVAQFDIEYSDNKLSYKALISDYYSICSNTYIQYTVFDELSENVFFEGNEFSDFIMNDNYSNITFELYSTIYGENTLLGKYTYNFVYYEAYVIDNVINIIGNGGDEYSSFTDFVVQVVTYNRNNEVIETINKNVITDENNDIYTNIDINNNVASLEYMILCNDSVIYTSSPIEIIPEYTFESYEMIEDGLVVTIPEILSTDEVCVIYDDEIVPITSYDGQIIIPMTTPNSFFDITINGYEYTIDPGELYYIKNIEMYAINEVTYFTVEGFSTTVNDLTMTLNYLFNGNVIDTFNINSFESNVFTYNGLTEGDSATIECIIKNGDEIIGEENITCEYIDSISVSFELGETELISYVYGNNSYNTEIVYYDDLDNVISSFDVELDNNEGIVNWVDCSYAKYKINIDNYSLYVPETISKINSIVTSTRISSDSKYLYYYTTKLTEDMNAYIIDKNGIDIEGIIYEEYIEFYIYDDPLYKLREIQNYGLHLSNSYDEKDIPVTLNCELVISDIGLENYAYGSNALIFTAAYLSEANYTLVVDAIVDGSIVKSERFTPSDLNTEIYALNNFNTSENMLLDTRFDIYLLDDNEVVIGDKQTFIVTKEMKESSDFTFRTPNISEILVTYNEDLINVYIPTEFDPMDNTNLVPRIVLNSTTRKYIFESTDSVIAIENIPYDIYSVTYQVVNKGNNINMIILDVTVSGSICEFNNTSPSIITEIIDDETYFWIDVSSYINLSFDESKTGVYDHDECYYDSNTNRLRIKANSLDEITLYIFTGDNNYETVYNIVIEVDPNINILPFFGTNHDVNIILPETISFTSDTTTIETMATGVKVKNSLITSSDNIYVYVNGSDTISIEALDGEFTIPLYDDNNEEYIYTEYLVSINSVLYLFRK